MASHVSPPPEYVSARLILRRFDDDDAEFVLGLHAHPAIARFIPSAVMSDIADAEAWIAETKTMSAHARGRWCVTLHDGTPVGAVIAADSLQREESGDEVEIGWRLHPDFGGRGFATEAGELLLSVCLASGLDRVIAVVDADNAASQAVCRRIGMAEVGETTRYYDQSPPLFDAGVGAPIHARCPGRESTTRPAVTRRTSCSTMGFGRSAVRSPTTMPRHGRSMPVMDG